MLVKQTPPGAKKKFSGAPGSSAQLQLDSHQRAAAPRSRNRQSEYPQRFAVHSAHIWILSMFCLQPGPQWQLSENCALHQKHSFPIGVLMVISSTVYPVEQNLTITGVLGPELILMCKEIQSAIIVTITECIYKHQSINISQTLGTKGRL